ncbi:hypothetical protein F5Y04DRAFT_244204 [Hypomontagnella monticulosa]|nr:hypothetical protein F5Y04DRAFT_244204 [Hypomontagnella monticulosa]
MVGVARSKRCQRCKRIKIKCDEKWPTCTPCIRAKVPCSGPPNLTKFIHSNRDASTTNGSERDEVATQFSISEKSASHLESIRQKGLPGGGSFGHFRMASNEPRKNLTTVADRVAARLVGYLAHEDAPWDILATIGYTKHLPVRLGESAALRDSVALMCSTWSNYRRNVPVAQLVDSNLYGKALRSLQRALDDRHQQLKCETLAAATVLERLEVVFDTRRPYHRTRHVLGIQGLMMKRGPPNPYDDLDVHLAFENHAALISHWLVEGGDNFYLTPPWKESLQQAWRILGATLPIERMDCYTIGYYFGYWPGLAHKFRSISNDPDIISQQAQAAIFRDEITDVIERLKSVGEPIIERAHRTGRVIEEPDPESPVGTKFHFESLDTMSVFISYAMIRTIFNRILYHSTVLLNQPDEDLQVENRELCRQTWLCMPFIKKLGMVTSILSASPVYMSYEGANKVEKEYLLDLIIEVAGYKGRYPKERGAVELLVLNAARAMIGASQFATSVSTAQEQQQAAGGTHTM